MGEPSATGTTGPPPSWLTPGLGATNPNAPQAGPNLGILQALQDAFNAVKPNSPAGGQLSAEMNAQGAPAQWPEPKAMPLMPVSPDLFRGLPKPDNPHPDNPTVYMRQLIEAMQQQTANRLRKHGMAAFPPAPSKDGNGGNGGGDTLSGGGNGWDLNKGNK